MIEKRGAIHIQPSEATKEQSGISATKLLPNTFERPIPKQALLEQAPSTLAPLDMARLRRSRAIPLLPRFDLSQRLHLLEHPLEKVLPPYYIDMPSNLGIFASKAVNFSR